MTIFNNREKRHWSPAVWYYYYYLSPPDLLSLSYFEEGRRQIEAEVLRLGEESKRWMVDVVELNNLMMIREAVASG